MKLNYAKNILANSTGIFEEIWLQEVPAASLILPGKAMNL